MALKDLLNMGSEDLSVTPRSVRSSVMYSTWFFLLMTCRQEKWQEEKQDTTNERSPP